MHAFTEELICTLIDEGTIYVPERSVTAQQVIYQRPFICTYEFNDVKLS